MEMKQRLTHIYNAEGWTEFQLQLETFMSMHNFSWEEINAVIHLLNSFYFMGSDKIDDIEEIRDEYNFYEDYDAL